MSQSPIIINFKWFQTSFIARIHTTFLYLIMKVHLICTIIIAVDNGVMVTITLYETDGLMSPLIIRWWPKSFLLLCKSPKKVNCGFTRSHEAPWRMKTKVTHEMRTKCKLERILHHSTIYLTMMYIYGTQISATRLEVFFVWWQVKHTIHKLPGKTIWEHIN